MNTHIDNHPQHLNANNTNNNANPMTSLSTSQSVELSKQSPKTRQDKVLSVKQTTTLCCCLWWQVRSIQEKSWLS